jgi:hypothetical protein
MAVAVLNMMPELAGVLAQNPEFQASIGPSCLIVFSLFLSRDAASLG